MNLSFLLGLTFVMLEKFDTEQEAGLGRYPDAVHARAHRQRN